MNSHRQLPLGTLGLLEKDLSFSIRRHPLPQPAPGEILVKIDCCTLCKSDIHTASGKRKEPLPSVLGHEAVGTVQNLGSSPLLDVFGNKIHIGDRIIWSVYSAPKGQEPDWEDREQKSPGIRKYGHLPFTSDYAFSGGLGSHMLLLPHTAIAVIPPDISPAILAPVSCSLATMVGAFRLGGTISSKRVAIIGAGMLGIQGAAYAAKRGAKNILLIDIEPSKEKWSQHFGADKFCLSGQLSKEVDAYDIVIETSGSVQGMKESLAIAALGATIVWVGAVFPQQEIPINPERMIRSLHSLKGLHNYSIGDFREAARHIIHHHNSFPYPDLVGATFKLEEIQTAFSYAKSKGMFRVAVKP